MASCAGPDTHRQTDETAATKPKCHACTADFQRKLRSRFVLSDSVLGGAAHDNSQSVLLRLPNEILLAIFASFGHPAGQVALALACKRLALLARDVDLSLSLTSRKYAGFLPLTVFDVPAFMKSLRGWMPGHLLLCNHCLTYRPRHAAEGRGQWTQRASWEFGNGGWHKEWNDICPMCNASCTFSDYVECDGCRVLGRLGNAILPEGADGPKYL